MTDQILKRLAQIEGLILPGEELSANDTEFWNPLTNPADTMALIEKYKVVIGFADESWSTNEWKNQWYVSIYPGYVNCPASKYAEARHESLSMAVCLAVIEANGGMDNPTSGALTRTTACSGGQPDEN